MGTLTKTFEFDSAHRVMNERFKCFNLHGHRFVAEVTFEYQNVGPLGYAMDFKELKRVVGVWIEEKLDHACILNPLDKELIRICERNKWKLYKMGLGREDDINPSAENMASELFYVISHLMSGRGVNLKSVKFYETPTCFVEVDNVNYVATNEMLTEITDWRKSAGEVSYDSRED